jgi:hypothetical protein
MNSVRPVLFGKYAQALDIAAEQTGLSTSQIVKLLMETVWGGNLEAILPPDPSLEKLRLTGGTITTTKTAAIITSDNTTISTSDNTSDTTTKATTDSTTKATTKTAVDSGTKATTNNLPDRNDLFSYRV